MRQRAIVLGSTGSIGCNALDVLAAMPDEWEVVGLAARSRAGKLAEQADRFRPQAIGVTDAACGPEIRSSLKYSADVLVGPDALIRLIDSVDCDCVVSAVCGADGVPATLRAVELGRRVALANKEAMVVAGALLVPLARKTGATIIPVDSEHSAIFQAMQAGRADDVARVFLTASGGPFRTWSIERMERATPKEALKHPTWNMGPKITIDSATMMNKALEIVEARWLFGVPSDRIEVVIHPESIIHSLVEFCDGSMMAQMGTPDMRTPIQYALTYPARRPCPSKRLDLFSMGALHFASPDVERFPALRLGHEVARRGGTSGAVLNGASEAAVELFRKGAIGFCDIARLTERALSRHAFSSSPSLGDLLEADRLARQEVLRQCTAC